MTQLAHPAYFHQPAGVRHAIAATAHRVTGLLQRVYQSLLLTNQRQAERDIARLVSTRGRFTDSLEREISERMMGGNWNSRF